MGVGKSSRSSIAVMLLHFASILAQLIRDETLEKYRSGNRQKTWPSYENSCTLVIPRDFSCLVHLFAPFSRVHEEADLGEYRIQRCIFLGELRYPLLRPPVSTAHSRFGIRGIPAPRAHVSRGSELIYLHLGVTQVIGPCPKYIRCQARKQGKVTPYFQAHIFFFEKV